jgi:hypothetical protein
MHHRVLVRKPLKTAWLNVAMRPQRFDGSIYDAAVGSAARKRSIKEPSLEPLSLLSHVSDASLGRRF